MPAPTARRSARRRRLLLVAAAVALIGCGPQPDEEGGAPASVPSIEPLPDEAPPAPEAAPDAEREPVELSQPAGSAQSAETMGESEGPAIAPPNEPAPPAVPPGRSGESEGPALQAPAPPPEQSPPDGGEPAPGPADADSGLSPYDEPPAALHDPAVVMSQGHADTCLVKVGDAFPEMTLPDLDGQEKNLSDLYGDRLTLVLFWSLRNPLAQEQFARLEREVVRPYSGRGLSVVAVHVGDAKEEVKELRRQAESTCSCLLDEGGQAFAKIASAKLPRTYLLDARGAILWFDIEYSLGARRELRNAIEVSLQDSK